MAKTFQLPELGEGIDSAEVVQILVQNGDEVNEGQALLVVESDKASFDVPASFSGKITKVHFAQGDAISPGQNLFDFEGQDQAGSPSPDAANKEEKAGQAGADNSQQGSATNRSNRPPESSASGSIESANSAESATSTASDARVEKSKGDSGGDGDRSAESNDGSSTKQESQKTSNQSDQELSQQDQVDTTDPAHGVPASPAARRYAREMGISINSISGSGHGGRITVEDVKNEAIDGGGARKSAAPGTRQVATTANQKENLSTQESTAISTQTAGGAPEAFGEVEVVALTATRKTISRRMAETWNRVPHVMHTVKADITAIEEIRRKNKDYAQAEDSHISALGFVIKAVVSALKKFPQFNAEYDEANQQLYHKKYYNIGIAVDSPNGLMVPVLRDADKKSILDIGREVRDLAYKARDGKIKPADFKGHSFSISNLGSIGGDVFSPIINAPDTAILGLMRSRVEPVFDGGSFVPRTLMPMCLSYDHRIIDGADAARFMNDVAELLAVPDKFFLNT